MKIRSGRIREEAKQTKEASQGGGAGGEHFVCCLCGCPSFLLLSLLYHHHTVIVSESFFPNTFLSFGQIVNLFSTSSPP